LSRAAATLAARMAMLGICEQTLAMCWGD